MANYGRISRLVAELQDRIELLAREVGVASTADTAVDMSRGRSRGQAGARAAVDMSKIIPPTKTEDPDSIVGGKLSTGFPDCCAVGDLTRYFCSGTLIAPNVVVTAGHCTGVRQVFLKGNNVDIPPDGEKIAVVGDFDHPTADLRVLVLERNSTVTPRHIAQGIEAQATECTLVGFGNFDFSGTVGFGVKREVGRVPITSLSCEAPNDASGFGCKPGDEMVAGHRGLGVDSCTGDSGGPLYIRGPLGNDYLLGATSRGITPAPHLCGDGGIYVRVDQLIDWIEEQTGVSIEGPLL